MAIIRIICLDKIKNYFDYKRNYLLYDPLVTKVLPLTVLGLIMRVIE